MDVREDISKIHKLKNAGLALIDFVECLFPDIKFEKKSDRWIPTENFVTFTIQTRNKAIKMSLRGNPNEFIQFKELSLKAGMGYGAYSECTFKSINQLPAILMHIRTAFEIYNKGRNRVKKKQSISTD